MDGFHNSVWFRPVIPLLLSFVAGVITALMFPGRWPWAVLVAVPALCMLFRALIIKAGTRLSPLFLYACLGYLAYAGGVAGPENPGHAAHYADGRRFHITGTIASEPVVQSFRRKCVLNDLSLAPVSGTSPPLAVSGGIQINIYGRGNGAEKRFAPGDRIALTGEIRPFRSFRNPGGFDYTRHMAWQDIWGSVSISAAKIKNLSSSPRYFQARLDTIREQLRSLIRRASDGDAEAVLAALVIGDREGITPALRTAFSRAGVSHVLAISGLHVGVVAAAAFGFFNWLLSFWRPLLMRAWTRKGAALAAVFPVVFYGVIAGMSPSTQRAVVMVVVFLLTFLIEREQDLFNTIALAALLILILHPPTLFSISFQLSFAAVLAIAFGMWAFREPIASSLQTKNRMIRFAGGLFLVTLFAVVGTAPLVMHYFNLFSLAGLFANLVVVPIMGSLVVSIGLFSALVLYPVSDRLALWGFQCCDMLLRPVIRFVAWLAEMPWSAVPAVTPSILEMACWYLLAAGGVLLLARKNKGCSVINPTARRWWPRVLAAAGLVLAADAGYWAYQRFWNPDFRVTVLDVGQGNAALLELPGGRCAVIDGGGFSDNAVFDVGERVVAPYLWRNKIRTVDTVILTHPDADHLNGLLYLLKHFHVKEVISTHQPSESAAYREFLDLIRDQGIRHPNPGELDNPRLQNGVSLRFYCPFAPPAGTGDGFAKADSPDANNHSLVVRAAFGGFSILFPGDIERAAEAKLRDVFPEHLRSTILIAPHHGSNTSSTPEFLDAVRPSAVIISSGKPDRFPSPKVLDRYRHKHYQIYRTDENGAVRIVMDGKGMRITSMVGKTAGENIHSAD